jgi:hypothetical protein
MSAPEGNQFWKARSKHGRDRVISDPETLANASDEYFEWCEENSIKYNDFRGKDADEVFLEKPRPFTKEGLARFCGLAQWRSIEELKEISQDFSQVVTRIEGIIAEQKYTYAVTGIFNSNIVARDLGLKDSTEAKTDGKLEVVVKYEKRSNPS